jgi:hypothetical protein
VCSIPQATPALVAGLDLDDCGRARRPIVFVDLDAGATRAEAASAAEAATNGCCLSVGLTTTPIRGDHVPLVEALSFTLTASEESASQQVVWVPDLDAAVCGVSDEVGHSPGAAVVLGGLLRQTAQLDVRTGLGAEAAAYSTLLAGEEFARWLTIRGGPRAVTAADEPVQLTRVADRLTITLRRPERRNAVDAALRDALVDALSIAVADPSLQLLLQGAGPDFCSGGDLDEFGSASDVVAAYLVRLERHPGWLLHRIRDRTTVELHGACVGAGIEMAAFAGRLVADPGSYFVLPELAMGLVPGAGGTVSIPRRIGRWRAIWLAVTGARLDAATALRWGLIDEVVGR